MGNTFELTADLLAPLTKSTFNDESASAKTFELVALKPGVGNPTSKGVYRAMGIATTAAGDKPFSYVVKHLADGQPLMDASSIDSWNYWKREILFFESPIAQRIPASLGYPKYLGQSTLDDGTVLFWNEDLGDLTKSKWTWSKCVEAVRIVAELDSIEISDEADYPFLCREMLFGWMEFRDEFFVPLFDKVRQCALANPETALAYETFGKYIELQSELASVVYSARQTFVHGDFNLNNLVPSEKGIIALDWQLVGISGIGIEIASIFNTTVELGVITEATSAHFEELCAVYVERFNELNPDAPVTLNEVRLVAATMGYSIMNSMGFLFARPQPGEPEEQLDKNIQRMVNEFSTGRMMIYSRVLDELL